MKFKWEILWISSLALWWFFPIVTIFTYEYLSFIYTLAFVTLFSMLFFLFFFIKNKEWEQFRVKEWWKYIIYSALLNWALFYIIMYYWLTFTNSTNASILSLSEIFFSYLFITVLFQDHKIVKHEIIWWLLMIIWIIIVLFQWSFTINYWDLFIIIATMIAPFGNQYARMGHKFFSTNFMLLIRSFVSTIILFIIAYYTSQISSFTDLKDSLIFLLFSWVILMGLSKYLWVESLKYCSVPKLASFFPLYPAFTVIYNIILFWIFPTFYQMLGFIPITLWIFIFFNMISLKKIKILK